MPADSPVPRKSRKRWLSRVRFSLRTLLLLTLLFGSVVTLWLHWQPWRRVATLTKNYEIISFASFSADYKKVIWLGSGRERHVTDANTGEELTSAQSAGIGQLAAEGVLDGRPIMITAGRDDAVTEEQLLPAALLGSDAWRQDFRARHAKPVTFELAGTLDEALQIFLGGLVREKYVFSQQLLDAGKPQSDFALRVKEMDSLQAFDWILKVGDVGAEYEDGVIRIVSKQEFSEHQRAKIDCNVCVWDLETLKPMLALSGQKSKISVLTLSANAKYVFAASEDGSARVWELPSGEQIATFSPSEDKIVKAAISNNGKRVVVEATHAEDYEIKHLALNTDSRNFKLLPVDSKEAKFIALSPDSKQACFISNVSDNLCNLETANLQNLGVPPDDGDFLETQTAPVFSAGTDRLLFYFMRTAHLSNSQDGKQISLYGLDVCAGQFSADGTRIAAIGNSNPLVIDAVNGEIIDRLPASNRSLNDIYWYVRSLFQEDSPLNSPFAVGPPRSPLPQFSAGGNLLVAMDHAPNLGVWSRRRPEYWWGVAWLPEFWLTVVLAGALVWSFWRDRKSSAKPIAQ